MNIRKFKRGHSRNRKVAVPSDNIAVLLKKALSSIQYGRFFEAEHICLEIVKLNPAKVDAWFYLGYALYSQGFLQQATDAYNRCIRLKPDYAKAYYHLSLVQHDLNLLPDAIQSLQRTIELDPDNAPARHKLAALSGVTTDSPPREYVAKLFDQYSNSFENDLINKLEYKIPSHLRNLLSEYLPENIHLSKAIDLGCGTGISGQAFHDIVDYIDAIDISKNMLEQARSKNIYNSMYLGDICDVLQQLPDFFNLFIATDVMIYIGNLEKLFSIVSNRSYPGAYFVFSIELKQKKDFILQQSCRYAHSSNYIEKLALANDFKIIAQKQIGIRKENNLWIPGEIYVLMKTPVEQ